MADRRVVVHVKVKLIMDVEEGVSIDNIISDMDYNFNFNGEEATINDTEIIDFNVIDSK
ncbi:MAG TPA: hypothetical protein P5136_01415 [Methanofastidiosum sp.]|nr:hypothetical protein [Methanofastidiosum sp.]